MISSGDSERCTVSHSSSPRERATRLAAGLLALALGSVTLLLAGCESSDLLPERMAERFQAPTPKVQNFDGDEHAVFEAAKAAVKAIGFRVTRAGAAQGVIRGISDVQAGDAINNARQYTIEIHLRPGTGSTTEVSVLLREQEESKAFSGATDLPLKEHGLYGSYFAALASALPAAKAGTPASDTN